MIAIAAAIGVPLLKNCRGDDMGSFAGVLALGLAVFWLLRLVPGIGLVASFLVAIVGLGALGMRAYVLWSSPASASVALR
jgi:hypothetical protein